MTKRKQLRKCAKYLATELHRVCLLLEAVNLSSRPTEDLLEGMITAFKQLNASCDVTIGQITALFAA